jgi:hypothetical protein
VMRLWYDLVIRKSHLRAPQAASPGTSR